MENKKITILVTGVGAIIGQGIIKSLKSYSSEIKVIGTDMNPLSVGFFFSDIGVVCPPANSKNYVPAIIKICLKYNVNLIMPGIEQDVDALAKDKKKIEQRTKARLIINSSKALKIGNDKWLTHLFLLKNKLPTPETFLPSQADIEVKSRRIKFPLVLKKRKTYAQKGMYIVNDAKEYFFYRQRLKEPYIVQEFIGSDDQEYTCGIFGRKDGTIIDKIIVMRRKLNYGSTFEAVIDDFPKVKEIAKMVALKLEPIGPTNIQIRMHKGHPLVLEINPRFSSSNSLRTLFGFNEAEMCIKHFILGENNLNPRIRKGRAVRYIEDYIIKKIAF